MEEIANRLAMEKADDEIEYYYVGWDAGYEWSEKAPYRKLRYTALFFKIEDDFGHFDPALVSGDKVLAEEFRQAFRVDPYMYWDEGKDYIDDLGQKWLKGWLEGVDEFWLHIESEIYKASSNTDPSQTKTIE